MLMSHSHRSILKGRGVGAPGGPVCADMTKQRRSTSRFGVLRARPIEDRFARAGPTRRAFIG
jgi:hypothetical protein